MFGSTQMGPKIISMAILGGSWKARDTPILLYILPRLRSGFWPPDRFHETKSFTVPNRPSSLSAPIGALTLHRTFFIYLKLVERMDLIICVINGPTSSRASVTRFAWMVRFVIVSCFFLIVLCGCDVGWDHDLFLLLNYVGPLFVGLW